MLNLQESLWLEFVIKKFNYKAWIKRSLEKSFKNEEPKGGGGGTVHTNAKNSTLGKG